MLIWLSIIFAFIVWRFYSYQYSPDQCDPNYYRFSLLKKNSTFLIHGLWIEQCSECPSCGYPSACDPNCDFNVSKLAPLFTRLHQSWFPGGDPTKSSILPHEWCKHGTCTNFSEIDYFNKSLNIYQELLDKDLLSLCNYHSSECFFVLNKNFTIRNATD
jgi:ribonuclease I